MNEQTNIEEDWRTNVSEPKPTLKIADKEVVVVKFLNEGEKKTHPDFGDSVVFTVMKVIGKEEMNWHVNPQNFSLLKQLKEIGTLTGKLIEISRIGDKKSDTRYSVKAIEEEKKE